MLCSCSIGCIVLIIAQFPRNCIKKSAAPAHNKNLLRSNGPQEVLGWEMILPDQPYTVTVRTSEARSSPYSVIREITISAVPGAWAVRLR